MDRIFQFLAKAYRVPVLILVLTFILVVWLSFGLLRVELDNDVHSMMPTEDPDVKIHNYYEQENLFGNSNLIFIGVESQDSYSVASLEFFQKIQASIEQMNHVLPVQNLAKTLGLDQEKASQLRSALASLGWNEQTASQSLQSFLALNQEEAQNLGLSPNTRQAIESWLRYNDARDLFRLWENPIASIQSLTMADLLVNEDGALRAKKLLENNEINERSIALLKARVKSWPLYQNVLISQDETLAAIVIKVANSYKTVLTSVNLALEKILQDHTQQGIKTYMTGESVIKDQIGIFMFNNISVLLPLVLFIAFLILFFCFRRWEGVVYPFMVMLVTVASAIGFMGWMNVSMNVVSVSMPVLLVAISGAYAIHQMHHYFLDSERDRLKVLTNNMKVVGLAITLSGLTLMIGFGALIIESFVPIRNFGVFTSIGNLFAMVAALFVLPALLLLSGRPKKVSNYSENHGLLGKVLKIFVVQTKQRPQMILMITFGLTIICAFGIFLVKSELNNVSFFKKNTPIYQADNKLNEKLAGTQFLNIVLDSDLTPIDERHSQVEQGHDLATISILSRIDEFSQVVQEKFPFVRKVLSLNDVIKKINAEMHGGSQEYYVLPFNQQALSQYLIFFSGDTKSMMTQGRDKLKITLTLNRTPVQNVDRVRTFALEFFGGDFAKKEELQVQVTGEAYLYFVANKHLVRGNIESLVLCLSVVFLLLLVVLRSFWMTMIALVPLFFTLIVNFGLLGFLKIPLNVGTAMVSSVAIGIGVDYSIHYITWYRNELFKGHSIAQAIELSILRKGRAILYNMLVIFGGFIVLTISQFVPLMQFGALVSLCMVTTALGSLLMVPSLIHLLSTKNFRFLYLGSKTQANK